MLKKVKNIVDNNNEIDYLKKQIRELSVATFISVLGFIISLLIIMFNV